MMTAGLTVGMMLWQEGQTLEAVLESFSGVCDRFILGVDRRSTDATAAIARQWAHDYFEFDFRNHFSEVRNEVLRRCRTPWFFQVDGHELLAHGSAPYIAEIKDSTDIDVVWSPLSIWDDHEPLLMFAVPRLFRSDRGITYTRAIHNTLTHVDGHKKYIGLSTRTEPGILLDHRQPMARQEMRSDQRRQISPQGIGRQVQDMDDPYDWYNLGVLQTYLNDGESAEASFKKTIAGCDRPDVRYQVKLFLAGLQRSRGDRAQALATLCSATPDDNCRCEHWMEIGDIYADCGMHQEARRFYHLAASYELPISQMTAFVPYYSYEPWERIMKACGRLGDLRGAIAAGERLREYRFFRHRDRVESYLEEFRRKTEAPQAERAASRPFDGSSVAAIVKQ